VREHIPLSAAMGMRVLEAGPERVRLRAPLEPNLNHRSTAFGGSVAALAILAGWALVHVRLLGEGVRARTVIQESAVRYDAPVHDAFEAVCEPPAPADWARFTRALSRRGKGRVRVGVAVESGGHAVATLHAAYVALAGPESGRAVRG
jgi:thioesterase domain-containing protein